MAPITSQLWCHLGSDNLWLSPRFAVHVLWLLEMWRHKTQTKELSVLSSSSSLLGWLQIWYQWPELCPLGLEVWSWVLPAVSLWAEQAGAVPTQTFTIHQPRVLQGVVSEAGKGSGAKGLLGKEIKAGPCCRDGRKGCVLEGAEGTSCFCRGWRVVSPPKGANSRWFLPSVLYIFSLLGKFSSAGYCLFFLYLQRNWCVLICVWEKHLLWGMGRCCSNPWCSYASPMFLLWTRWN